MSLDEVWQGGLGPDVEKSEQLQEFWVPLHKVTSGLNIICVAVLVSSHIIMCPVPAGSAA
jgi:hypothetical protein